MVETKPTWSYRYVNISLVLIGLCFPAIWFYVGYRGHSLNEMLSFTIADGWCARRIAVDRTTLFWRLRGGRCWTSVRRTSGTSIFRPARHIHRSAFSLSIAFVYDRPDHGKLGAGSGSVPPRACRLHTLAGPAGSHAEAGEGAHPTALVIIGIATAPIPRHPGSREHDRTARCAATGCGSGVHGRAPGENAHPHYRLRALETPDDPVGAPLPRVPAVLVPRPRGRRLRRVDSGRVLPLSWIGFNKRHQLVPSAEGIPGLPSGFIARIPTTSASGGRCSPSSISRTSNP